MNKAVSKYLLPLCTLLFGVFVLWSSHGYHPHTKAAAPSSSEVADYSSFEANHNLSSFSSLSETKLDLRAEKVEEEVEKIGFKKDIGGANALHLLFYALLIPHFLSLFTKGISFDKYFSFMQVRTPIYLRFGVLRI